MSDLADFELAELRSGEPDADQCERAAREIERHRAARAVDAERVRSVVRDAASSIIAALSRYETYDEAAIAIAARAAEQLAGAGVGLSAEERNHLLSIRSAIAGTIPTGSWLWKAEFATIDRLLASPPALAAPQIPAQPCYQDPATSTAWCAVHNEVPDWHSEISGYRGPAGWVCAAGGLFNNAKSAAASAEYDAKFAADPPPPAPDLNSAICALLDSDMPAGDLRKALAELVGRR